MVSDGLNVVVTNSTGWYRLPLPSRAEERAVTTYPWIRTTSRSFFTTTSDLAHVPMDKLIVLNMHIPIYAFIDQNFARQMMDNARQLCEILGCPTANDGEDVMAGCERHVLVLSVVTLHLADPKAVAERDRQFSADPERRRREMDRIYRYDVVAEHSLIG